MFLSTLPDLTPRDPHSLWYTSRHPPTAVPHHLLTTHDPSLPHDAAHNHHPHPRDRDARRALLERTALARLRHDEAVMDRRRLNVANYGTQWIKPPGVAKTLFQIREERREAHEHAEAVRREQTLAAQMAEAEAEQDNGLMDEEDEEVDLDGDIPEGDGFGFDGEDSDDEDMESDSEEDDDDDEDVENVAGAADASPAEEEQVRGARAAEDRLMDIMAREAAASDVGLGFAQEGEAVEEMLEEDNLLIAQPTPQPTGNPDMSMSMDVDMDADLDGEIPDADTDEYEHTDSDEEIDDPTREISFAGRSSTIGRPPRPLRRSSLRSRGSVGPTEAADISELLSGEGSSFMDNSPYPQRRG